MGDYPLAYICASQMMEHVPNPIRRLNEAATASRPAGYNDGHGAAKSRRVAGAPAATRAPPPAAGAPDRGPPHGLGWRTTHRRQFTRWVQFGQVNRVASVGFPDPDRRACAESQGATTPAAASTSARSPTSSQHSSRLNAAALFRERIRYYCRFALVIVDEIGYLPVTARRW